MSSLPLLLHLVHQFMVPKNDHIQLKIGVLDTDFIPMSECQVSDLGTAGKKKSPSNIGCDFFNRKTESLDSRTFPERLGNLLNS